MILLMSLCIQTLIQVTTGYFLIHCGFITAWGGANTHMAIRASEQQVPAVIGAGELLYNQWSSSNKIMIDCAEKRVDYYNEASCCQPKGRFYWRTEGI